MKNQGVWITKIVTLAIGVFVTLYMGYHIFEGLRTSIPTTTVVLMETEQMYSVEGYFARDEVPLQMPDGLIKLAVSEGEKVHDGQVIALTYPNAASMQTGSRLEALQEQSRQLGLLARIDDSTVDVGQIDAQIEKKLISILNSVDGRSFAFLENESAEWKALLFKREYAVGNSIDVSSIEQVISQEIVDLQSQTMNYSSVMRAPMTGVYCSSADGLEAVWNTADLKDISVKEYTEKSSVQQTFYTGNTGRLATGLDWYYVTLIPDNLSSEVAVGKTVSVRFTGEVSTVLPLEVAYLSPVDNGNRVVVFKSRKYLAYFINMRASNADLIFETYKGLRVPKDAVRIDEDGNYYVYCLVLTQVVKKKISIIREIERENYYLALYTPTDLGGLMPGDEVITADKNLHDGQIIRR